MILLLAATTYVIIATTGIFVEEETHVLVEPSADEHVTDEAVDADILYELRAEMQERIEEENAYLQKLKKVEKRENFEAKVNEFRNYLNQSGKRLLEMNESELEQVRTEINERHQDIENLQKQ